MSNNVSPNSPSSIDAAAEAHAYNVDDQQTGPDEQNEPRWARAKEDDGDDAEQRPKLTMAEATVYRDLQRQLIGASLRNKRRAEKIFAAADHFDRNHRLVLDAMKQAAERGEALQRPAFRAFLKNADIDGATAALAITSFDHAQSVARKAVGPVAQQVAEVFGTPAQPPEISALEFDQNLELLRRFPKQTATPQPTGPLSMSLDGLPLPVRQLVSYFSDVLVEQPNVRHVAAALFCMAAVVGKRIRFTKPRFDVLRNAQSVRVGRVDQDELHPSDCPV